MVDFSLEDMKNIITCVLYDIYDLVKGVKIDGNAIYLDGQYKFDRYASGRYKVYIKGSTRWVSVMSLNGTNSVKGCHPEDLIKYILQQYMDRGFGLWMERNYLAGA